MPRRAGDRSRLAAFWGRYVGNLVTVAAVGLAAIAVVVADDATEEAKRSSAQALRASKATHAAVRRMKRAQRARIHATCLIQEGKQRSDISALRRTYEYLSGLEPSEFGTPLNRAVLANLPATIREAQTDDAPFYCDRKGVGEAEPDPDLPKRPPGIPNG